MIIATEIEYGEIKNKISGSLASLKVHIIETALHEWLYMRPNIKGWVL